MGMEIQCSWHGEYTEMYCVDKVHRVEMCMGIKLIYGVNTVCCMTFLFCYYVNTAEKVVQDCGKSRRLYIEWKCERE